MKKILFKISISIIALILLILHLFSSTIKFDFPGLILLGLILLPWLSLIFENVEIFGFKGSFIQDNTPNDFIEFNGRYEENQTIIVFKGSEIITRINNTHNLLALDARINFNREGGSSYLLKILVNNVLIDAGRLKNKSIIKEYNDGRKFQWYLPARSAWNLQFSPDFSSNYFHPIYHVVNGDPYSFVFDITDIAPIETNSFKIELIHCGTDENPAHRNYLVVSNLIVY